jgi:hypothetical protein
MADAKEFNPNRLSFDQGLERIQRALDYVKLDAREQIVTSKDPLSIKLRGMLEVDNIPDGFKKWQLPVYLDQPSQLFISVGAPGTKVGRHSHDEGDGIRFIAGGSIFYQGQELTAGDWMFIPKGRSYEFDVGPVGALMCYCYCCCCA